jgi:acetyltransferase-like isoleucine patch superfamily enzyme
MKNSAILKLCIILIKPFDVFQIVVLREIRWFLYRKYFEAPKLYVDSRVDISTAHKNKNASFEGTGKINLGKDVYIDYSGGVKIGHAVAISSGAKIFTHNHDINGKFKDWQKNGITYSSLEVEDYVWVGSNALIMPSVKKLGEGSIVGSGAIVTKDTEAYGIYVGNPAKKIATRKVEELNE